MRNNLIIYIQIFYTIVYGQFNWQDGGVPIRQGLNIEWYRTGDANLDGSTTIHAWSDCRNGPRGIFAQKVDINGNNLWGEYGIPVAEIDDSQEHPLVVIDGNGGAYIIWMDYRNASFNGDGDIYAQHILDDGSLDWDIDGVALTNQPGMQVVPNLCSDGVGGAYVIWTDYPYGDVYATHLSSQGIIAQGEGVVIISYPSGKSYPSIHSGGSGEAVLVWNDDRNSSTNLDIYAQRISVGSNTINTLWGDGGKLICDAAGPQERAKVWRYGADKTIISWEDSRNSFSSRDLYYQILDENGDGQLTYNGESACSGNWNIRFPRVKGDNSEAYIIWEDHRNITEDIYAQKINSDGSIAWGENGRAIVVSDGDQISPRLITDGIGGAYFVWEDNRDSTATDIYAQHVDSNDSFTFETNGTPICNAENIQQLPLLLNNSSGGVLVNWSDFRSGSNSLFFQHLTLEGIQLQENGQEFLHGIDSPLSSFSMSDHNILYLGNDEALAYWQDYRSGYSGIYGLKITPSFDATSDILSNESVNGQLLTSVPSEWGEDQAKVIVAGDKILFSFRVQGNAGDKIYLQLLNIDLSQNGDAILLFDNATQIQDYEMVYGNDGYIYFGITENYNLLTTIKINTNGEEQWSMSAFDESWEDKIVKSMYSLPGSGAIIIYEWISWQDGAYIFAIAVDGNGNAVPGWPVVVCDLPSSEQYYVSSVQTENGLFITFINNAFGSEDMYGQYITNDGLIAFGPFGISITSGNYTNITSSLAYNQYEDKVIFCYEAGDNTNKNIYCKDIQLSNQLISDEITINDDLGHQSQPSVSSAGNSYLIAWNDARNGSGNKDIYFQEYNNDGSFTFEQGGIALCTFDFNQGNPLISKYSDAGDFVVIWDDYRGSGKQWYINLYGQSYSTQNCPDSIEGDANFDGTVNVLDVVLILNYILNDSFDICFDLNADGQLNILDIVLIVNIILEDN